MKYSSWFLVFLEAILRSLHSFLFPHSIVQMPQYDLHSCKPINILQEGSNYLLLLVLLMVKLNRVLFCWLIACEGTKF